MNKSLLKNPDYVGLISNLNVPDWLGSAALGTVQLVVFERQTVGLQIGESHHRPRAFLVDQKGVDCQNWKSLLTYPKCPGRLQIPSIMPQCHKKIRPMTSYIVLEPE